MAAAPSCSNLVSEIEITSGSIPIQHDIQDQLSISDMKNLSLDFFKSRISSNFEILRDILIKKEFSWRHESYLIYNKKEKNALEKSDGFCYFTQEQMIFIYNKIKDKFFDFYNPLNLELIPEQILTSQSPKKLKDTYFLNVLLPEFLLRLTSEKINLAIEEIDSKFFCLSI